MKTFEFYVNNQLANKIILNETKLKTLFKKWLTYIDPYFLRNISNDQIVLKFISDKESLNASFRSAHLNVIVDLLKPFINEATE